MVVSYFKLSSFNSLFTCSNSLTLSIYTFSYFLKCLFSPISLLILCSKSILSLTSSSSYKRSLGMSILLDIRVLYSSLFSSFSSFISSLRLLMSLSCSFCSCNADYLKFCSSSLASIATASACLVYSEWASLKSVKKIACITLRYPFQTRQIKPLLVWCFKISFSVCKKPTELT